MSICTLLLLHDALQWAGSAFLLSLLQLVTHCRLFCIVKAVHAVTKRSLSSFSLSFPLSHGVVGLLPPPPIYFFLLLSLCRVQHTREQHWSKRSSSDCRGAEDQQYTAHAGVSMRCSLDCVCVFGCMFVCER